MSRWDESSSGSHSKDQKAAVPLVKSVSFAEHNEVFEITHLDEFPASEVAAIWYDANEYANIKKSYQLTIFLMESGEPLTGEEHTSRGLEYRTQEGAWARYENKRDAYNAVLDEQDRQWKVDKDDWDKISSVYLEHSAKCLKAAQDRGKNDENEAAVVHKSTKGSATSEKKVKKKKKKVPKEGKEGKDPASPKKKKDKVKVKGEKTSKPDKEKSEKLSKGEKASSSTKAVVETAKQQLQEQTSQRRTEIREDIKRESAKAADKSTSST